MADTTTDSSVIDDETRRRAEQGGIGNPWAFPGNEEDKYARDPYLRVAGIVAGAIGLSVAFFAAPITTAILAPIALAVAAVAYLHTDRKHAVELAAKGELDEDSDEYKALGPYGRHVARHKASRMGSDEKKDYKSLNKHKLNDITVGGRVVQEGIATKMNRGLVGYVGKFFDSNRDMHLSDLMPTKKAGAELGLVAATAATYLGVNALGVGSLVMIAGLPVAPLVAAAAVAFMGYKMIESWTKGRIAKRENQVKETRVRVVGRELEGKKGQVKEELEELVSGEGGIEDLEAENARLKEENENTSAILESGKENGEDITPERRKQLELRRKQNNATLAENDVTLNGDPDDSADKGLYGKRDALEEEIEDIEHDIDQVASVEAGDIELDKAEFYSEAANDTMTTLRSRKAIKDRVDENGIKTNIGGVFASMGAAFKGAVSKATKTVFFWTDDERTKKREKQKENILRKRIFGAAPAAPTK